MSGRQATLTDAVADEVPDEAYFRSIVKDAFSTRSERGEGETRVEIVAWRVESVTSDDDEDSLKDESGSLRYDTMLDAALDELGAEELARRTSLKSYADERGGRAASTIRGYRSSDGKLRQQSEGGLPSDHPLKRVLRRFARSRDLGHYEDDSSTDRGGPELVDDPRDAAPIDLGAMNRAYSLARSIASQNGFVFAPRSGEPTAVEDNELIDADEVRARDRPLGDTKAVALVEKASGSVYEYEIDLDSKSLDSEGYAPPPEGAI